MSHYLKNYPVFSIARAVLETTMPLAVSSGRTNHVFDNDLVRDANGLPMIPGTAIAGVLRHLYWREYGETAMENIFGLQDGVIGAASLVEVSTGSIHDSKNDPAAPHYSDGDSLLDFARETLNTPIYRDRIAINSRGAPKATGKFDRTVLPAGFRFSMELVLHSSAENRGAFGCLLALLDHPLFRLGASTRAGLGACHVVKIAIAQLDLGVKEEAARFRTIERNIGSLVGLQVPATASHSRYYAAAEKMGLLSYKVAISPIAAWRTGQGQISLHGTDEKAPDLLPRLEQRVHWKDNVGALGPSEIVLPATSLKGALRHRAYFYACCEVGYFAEVNTEGETDSVKKKQADAAISTVFGDANNNDDGAATGSAGNLIINDLFLPIDTKVVGTQMHNALDRFTGGVRNRMLFSEELIFDSGRPLTIDIWLDEKKIGLNDAAECGKRALLKAIDDFAQGRLAVGGGSTKGHGRFRGNVQSFGESLANKREIQHAN